MNKTKKLTILLVMCMLLSGCLGRTEYEVANYQGQLAEGETQSDFNKELFYRNDKKTGGADPFVLDNTEVDGYYYMYVTEGSLYCHRSKDMMNWEPVGNSLDNLDYGENGAVMEIRKATRQDLWAPEVIYDPDTELYYLFFSATPTVDETVKAENGVEEGSAKEVLMVATSKYPYRDFQLVNFKDADSCGKENVHTYSESQYPHYYAKYLLFDPVTYKEFSVANGRTDAGKGFGGYAGGIDPHPYVDENGDKYLFWVDSAGADRICGVKMENWLKPDWSTATALIYHSYYTVADWQAEQEGKSVQKVAHELSNVTINEGPVVTKHNDKYYLTFSIGSYADSSYQVAQAVSDNLMGPYRKLTEEEGGILISGGTTGSQEISGTGHHSFVTVGEQTYIVYHRHDDFVKAGGVRNHAIDEIKWITIKDKDGNDLEVMYANGPTCTVQPKIEGYSDYKNIADEAKVSGTEDVSYLTDGLLSIYKYANENFIENIKETSIQKKTTFTFDFDEERTVRAVMIYNSKFETTSFKNISKVEFVCEENGEEIIRCINDMEFSSEYYKANDLDGSMYYIVSGAAAYAEFDELKVKAVKVTVDVPKGQESVGISEVRILGK